MFVKNLDEMEYNCVLCPSNALEYVNKKIWLHILGKFSYFIFLPGSLVLNQIAHLENNPAL